MAIETQRAAAAEGRKKDEDKEGQKSNTHRIPNNPNRIPSTNTRHPARQASSEMYEAREERVLVFLDYRTVSRALKLDMKADG
jgi:hypothetical protein